MLWEKSLNLPDGTIDADGNRAARKKDWAENDWECVGLEVTQIYARRDDKEYPTDTWTRDIAEDAFKRDFPAQDPREQPNIEGFNLKPCLTFVDEGEDLDMDSVSPERLEELKQKYGSPDLVNEFICLEPEPVIVKIGDQGNVYRIHKDHPDYPSHLYKSG